MDDAIDVCVTMRKIIVIRIIYEEKSSSVRLKIEFVDMMVAFWCGSLSGCHCSFVKLDE